MAATQPVTDVLGDVLQKVRHILSSDGSHLDPDKVSQNDDVTSIEEVGAGNMNYVMRFTYGQRSLIAKYAPPYIKIIGPAASISQERVKKEYMCMVKCEEVCPGSVPKPLYLCEANALLLMEDLRRHEVMKFAMKECRYDLEAVQRLVLNIAKIHQNTHVSRTGAGQFQAMVQSHKNPDLVDGLTREYVFERPYDAADQTNHTEPEVAPVAERLRANPVILAARDHLKQVYLSKKECLLHGDLHNGSVMVCDGDAKMIDSEFCTIGPSSWDVSYIVAHYLFSYYYHNEQYTTTTAIQQRREEHKAMAAEAAAACVITCDFYKKNMLPEVDDLDAFYGDFFSELAGFIGIELIRRTMGVAHPEDIRGFGSVEKLAIEAGETLLLHYKSIHDSAALMKTLEL